jgi:hypothetical protein
MVEYAADFFILRPAKLRRVNSVLVYDVTNRGRKMIFNSGGAPARPFLVSRLMLQYLLIVTPPRKRGFRGGRTSLALDSRWCGNDGTGSCCQFLPRLVEDHCGAFFGDHDGRGVGVGRGDGREPLG